LSYLHFPRPFKNPEYTKNANRRTKNLKTVLTQEKERERADRERRRLEKEQSMDVDQDSDPSKAYAEEEEVPTCECPYTVRFAGSYCPIDASIEAPPSFLPQRRYCDITGLEVRS
jgi:INO80 complex subunit C